MMTRTGFLFFGAALAASALASSGVGCGNGSGNAGGSGGTGGTGTSGTQSTSHSSSGTSMSSSDSASSGTTMPVKCSTLDCGCYCNESLNNCTGANAQFNDMATCMGTCAAYPPGTAADMTGNTLGCRVYHAGAASTDAAAATTHCPHGGPTGGDKNPGDTTAGTCGEACDSFCTIAMKVCAGQPTAYPALSNCMAECFAFTKDTAEYSTADTATNDYGCRMYHLTAASGDAASATTHCPHIRLTSTTCIQ